MSRLIKKIKEVDKRMTSKKQSMNHERLLSLEMLYQDAVKRGIIKKAKYDILDVLQMETLFSMK